MLAKRNRLSAAGVQAVRTCGRVYKSPHFVVRIEKDPEEAGVAVVVSRKIAPKAVNRNRLRRRLYAALAECGGLSFTSAAVVFVRRGADALSSAALCGELSEVFDRAHDG